MRLIILTINVRYTRQRKEQELYRRQATQQITLFQLFVNRTSRKYIGLSVELLSFAVLKSENDFI
jgi:hypothetical protein